MGNQMTPRERIMETLNHREPDVLPIDFGAMRSTGIHIDAYLKLKKYLGISNGRPRLYDVFQQLAEPESEVLERMGGDVVQAHRLCPAFGIRIDKWKIKISHEGDEYMVPRDYSPVGNENKDLEIRDGDTVIAKMPESGYYFDLVNHPYENVASMDDIDRIPIPEITEEEIRFLEEETRELYEKTDKAVLLSFGGNILEAGQQNWGYEKFFADMALNPELVHYWLDKLTDAYMRDLEKIMERTGEYINIIQFGDDLGTQEALQISPAMYGELIKPYHARQFQYVRKNYPDVKVFMHSCGAIYELIPDLIDAGVEILNPVQISAKGMDPTRLKKEFGEYLTFWGGGANMQHTVLTGTLEQIRGEVRELVEIFSPGGGFVFNQVHNIQADVPPEKIIAIYDTALQFRL